MLNIIGQALYFFLPAYVGNAAPVLLDRLGLFCFLAKPIDGGRIFHGDPLFGKTKTWRGLAGGAIAGAIVAGFQMGFYFWFPHIASWHLIPYTGVHILFLGFLMGLGEGLGDLFKSFCKRRLHVPSSAPFFPFDQMSFLGALLLVLLIFTPSAAHILAIIILSPFIPVLANFIAYQLGWKNVPW